MPMSNALQSLLVGRQGHFQMESGYHGEQWFDLDALFKERLRLQPFANELAERLAPHRLDAICGPMTGGAELAAMIATSLNCEYFHTDRIAPPGATGLFPVRYRVPSSQREHLRGKAVAIVDDAISAGSAVGGTHADLLACGARPVALGALFVFGDAAARFAAEKKLPLEAMVRMPLGLWKPAECPHCHAGMPFEHVSDAPTGNSTPPCA